MFQTNFLLSSGGQRVVTRRTLHTAIAAVIGCLIATGCGGGGGSASSVQPLAPAGTQTLTKSAVINGSGGNISDGAGATIVIPAGAMVTGANVQLIEWSAQRPIAQIPTCTQTPKAIDIVVAPSEFIGNGTMTVNLPWNTLGDPIGTAFEAFGPIGIPFVLTQTPASTQASPQVTISAEQVAYVGGVSVTSTKPVEFEIAIEQIPLQMPGPGESQAMSKMTVLWKAPETRTHYAGRRRIALTVHGVMNTSQDVLALKNFMLQKTKTDGDATATSFPFDEVDAYDYDYKDTIENNGALLAAKINSLWGDPNKYEVHVFGHSMGGIVARWAVEQSGTPSVVQLVNIGSPSNGVPIEAMREWWSYLLLIPVTLTHGLVNACAPGTVELTQGSALLAKLHNSTVPVGVTFQAIGGTKPDLLIAGNYFVANATTEILKEENRLPSDGFVPLDSAFANAATSKLSVPYNHSNLCDQIQQYWPGSTAATWTDGINRKIAKLLIPTLKITLTPQGVTNVTVIADDKDGDQLDPGLLFDATLPNGANPALKWSVGDPTIVSLSAQDQLSITLTGLKVGSTTVTVTDPASGSKTDVLVQVGPGNVLITPPNKTVTPGSHTTFTVSLVTGTIPVNTKVIWTINNNGLINGVKQVSSTAQTVDYLAPDTSEVDTITVDLRDANNVSLGTISTPIKVLLDVSLTPENPTVAVNAKQQFLAAAVLPSQFPQGAKFRWTLTGAGSLAGGSPVITTVPNIVYTAGKASGSASLKVEVLDSSLNVVGTATAAIAVGAASVTYTVTGDVTSEDIPPLVDGTLTEPFANSIHVAFPNLNHDNGVMDWTDPVTTNSFDLVLTLPLGGTFAKGQQFTYGTVAGQAFGFHFLVGTGDSGYIFNAVSGSASITSVLDNGDGTFTIGFTGSATDFAGCKIVANGTFIFHYTYDTGA